MPHRGARARLLHGLAPLVLFLPLVTDTACSAAVGLPVYNAQNATGADA